jgi:hypothetical protein
MKGPHFGNDFTAAFKQMFAQFISSVSQLMVARFSLDFIISINLASPTSSASFGRRSSSRIGLKRAREDSGSCSNAGTNDLALASL